MHGLRFLYASILRALKKLTEETGRVGHALWEFSRGKTDNMPVFYGYVTVVIDQLNESASNIF